MRLLSMILLLLVCCGSMRQAHSQTIPWVMAPCAGCTTLAQQQASAVAYFNTWINKTPPGYVGTVTAPSCLTTGTQTHVGVASPALSSTFYSCWQSTKKGLGLVIQLGVQSTDPCYFAKNVAPTPCVTKATNSVNFTGSTPKVTTPSVTPLAWGTTANEILYNFPQNFLHVVQINANLNALMTATPVDILARWSIELKALDTAMKLSAPNLRLLQSAVGPALMTAAMTHATAAVQAAYNALPVRAPLMYSQYAVSLGGKTYPINVSTRYMYDLFLLQYFSTNDTPTVALHKAVTYLHVRIKGIEGPIVVFGAFASFLGIVNFFDPTAWQDIQDWWYFTSIDPRHTSGGGPFGQIITVPDPSIEWPPIDPSAPVFPSAVFDDYAFDFKY